MNVMPVAGLGVAVLVLIGFAALFNQFIRSRNRVREAWSGIDVQLKRRHDLVSRLVACVKGYRAHEQGVLEQVSNARSDAIQARGVEQTGQAETELARNLHQLVVVAEAYPELKASESFRQLSGTLVELEDQLQYARRYYNGAVRDFNTLVESFPSNLVAGLAGFRVQPFFSLESATEREAPEVTL